MSIIILSWQITNLEDNQIRTAVRFSPALLEALPGSMGKDVELTYRDGTKVTGFIQGTFSDPDGLIVHKHKWPQGESPLIRATVHELRGVKIEYDLYEIKNPDQ